VKIAENSVHNISLQVNLHFYRRKFAKIAENSYPNIRFIRKNAIFSAENGARNISL
jgi:hypothetical protein